MHWKTLLILLLTTHLVLAADKQKKKKDLTSYTDADLEKLYEEWEENDDEELEEDEKPEHKRKPPQMDLDSMKAKAKNPEDLLAMSKKGQTLMLFVGVIDPAHPDRTDIRPFTEKWTALWQSQLYNNHVDLQVFVIDDNRAIFMFKDGEQAFEAKKFLLKQEYVTEVTIEGQSFDGPAKKLKTVKKEL
ncbi:CBN-BMY-1 protein [Caenorhabditis brenneri]|uniref:CBN-BMY-1 protein n=1 Tax=Caenorhabditis brenneri TaxID=135651 RepID=G0NAY4_CAEBE|nr:CBN-BMY-1 protein [Caenorhabditis brenneri]